MDLCCRIPLVSQFLGIPVHHLGAVVVSFYSMFEIHPHMYMSTLTNLPKMTTCNRLYRHIKTYILDWVFSIIMF